MTEIKPNVKLFTLVRGGKRKPYMNHEHFIKPSTESKLESLPLPDDFDKWKFYGEIISDLPRQDLLKLVAWFAKENQRLTNELYASQDRLEGMICNPTT